MQKIQWGIIGCGDVTEVKSGPAFNMVEGSQLVAVMRRNAAKARDYAKRHGVPKWYADAEELIHDPDVNAIYVATPPLYHAEYAIKAMEAGKPVYVEKPMAMNASEGRRMAAVSRQTGCKLVVAHYRREQIFFTQVKSLLENDRIGKVRLVNMELLQPDKSSRIARTEVNWRLDHSLSGGGLFHDLAPHQLDLMLYFFGKPGLVKGISLNNAGMYDADDTVSCQIVFGRNILFTGLWSFVAPAGESRDSCEIIGDKGRIRFSVFDHQPLRVEIEGNEEIIHIDRPPHVQAPMIAKVVRYFQGLDENPCTGEEGAEVMALIDAITGKPEAG